MSTLSLFIAFFLILGFGFSTASIAVAVGMADAMPRWLLRYLQAVAGGGPIIAGGRHVLAVVVFGGFTAAILAVQLDDLAGGSRTGDRAIAAAQLVLELLWVGYLGRRVIGRSRSTPIEQKDEVR